MIEPSVIGALLGGVVGFILALTGAGGGILAVPLLVFGLHLSVSQAAPVGLIAVGLAATVGAAMGWREGLVRYRAAGLIGLTGMALAPLGVWLAQRVPNAPLLVAFGGVLAWVAWRMFTQTRHMPSAPAAPGACPPAGPIKDGSAGDDPLPCVVRPGEGRLIWTLPCARALAGTGMVSGLLSGLLGVGGGFVIVPALTRYTNIATRSILATSLAVIALVSIGGISAAAVHGAIDWRLAMPFSIGAVSALLLGRLVAARLAGARLQQAFAVVCLLVSILMVVRGFTAGLTSP